VLRPDLFIDERIPTEDGGFQNSTSRQAMRHVRHHAHRKQRGKKTPPQALLLRTTTTWGTAVFNSKTRAFRIGLESSKLARFLPMKNGFVAFADLEEVHTLAHVMNRTRRRDIGRFTTREPRKVSVPFTAAQQEFYQTLIQFVPKSCC